MVQILFGGVVSRVCMEEFCQRCSRFAFCYDSLSLSILENDSLLVFQMYVKRLDGWMAIVQREVENAPRTFHGANVSAVDVVLDFISHCVVNRQ